MAEVPREVTFDVASAGTIAADAAFWELYDESFPSNEREPRSVILETMRRSAGVTVRARRNEVTVGLAIAHLLQNPAVAFVVYLAVAPELRSHHIGAALFDQLWAASARKYTESGLQPRGMVWEVDIPEQAGSERGQQLSRRRIGFFERLGGHLLKVRYFQPPVDGITAVPMRLMYRPATGESLPEATWCTALVRAMYFEKYQQANGISESILQELLRRSAE